MIFGLGIPELLLIALVIVLVFGPASFSRLGKALRSTRDRFVRETGDGAGDGEGDDEAD